jgi:hypothetical protein
MNARQKALYNYLIEVGDVWVTQMGIAYDLYDWYDCATFGNTEDFHDSTTRLEITKDIQAINNDDEADKIIITSPLGVKIATEEECAKYLALEYASVFRRLARVRKKEKKAKLHNQITIDGVTVNAYLENFAKPIDN